MEVAYALIAPRAKERAHGSRGRGAELIEGKSRRRTQRPGEMTEARPRVHLTDKRAIKHSNSAGLRKLSGWVLCSPTCDPTVRSRLSVTSVSSRRRMLYSEDLDIYQDPADIPEFFLVVLSLERLTGYTPSTQRDQSDR